MEKTDEKAALGKILAILNEHAPKYYESAIAAAAEEAAAEPA
jgi:CarD family transcriptional regulator